MGTTELILAVTIASVGLLAWSLVDIAARTGDLWPAPPALSRTAWILIVLLTGAVGGLAYLFVGPPARLGPRSGRTTTAGKENA